MARTRSAIPSYLFHRPTGQARVRWQGRDYYLGMYGSPESKQRYSQIVAEITASGSVAPSTSAHITVAELVERYDAAMQIRYARSKPSVAKPALGKIKRVLGLVVSLYGSTPAAEFGPVKLAAVRAEMVKLKWCRKYVNKSVDEVRRCWRWACGTQELVPGETVHKLEAFPSLRRGESSAPESDKVRPVPEADLTATLAKLSRIVRTMVELQALTGMRTTEVLRLRPADVDRSGRVPQPMGPDLTLDGMWTYRPAEHKNDWRGMEKVILIGPRGQALLAPFLDHRDPTAWCFSPLEAIAEQNELRRAERKTPLWPSHLAAQERKRQGQTAKDHYTLSSYRQAIQRACRAAGVTEWAARQLRKNAATRIGREYGPDVARIVLGHADLAVTQVYLFDDLRKAASAILASG